MNRSLNTGASPLQWTAIVLLLLLIVSSAPAFAQVQKWSPLPGKTLEVLLVDEEGGQLIGTFESGVEWEYVEGKLHINKWDPTATFTDAEGAQYTNESVKSRIVQLYTAFGGKISGSIKTLKRK